jgi:hypothetical protein
MRKLSVSELVSVPQLSCITRDSELQEISSILDQMECHVIERMPWELFPYKPQVSFSIAYTDDCILLKYYVQEKTIRVVHTQDNAPVHEDSCVEFFIAFNDDDEYYNLEFNCGGACLFGLGKSISKRQLIGQEVINKIRRQSVIQRVVDGENRINWELTLVIPLEIFIYHPISHLKGRQCRVNFYKCGDLLPEPHFLAWKNIDAASPNFHLPEFFGLMYFE